MAERHELQAILTKFEGFFHQAFAAIGDLNTASVRALEAVQLLDSRLDMLEEKVKDLEAQGLAEER